MTQVRFPVRRLKLLKKTIHSATKLLKEFILGLCMPSDVLSDFYRFSLHIIFYSFLRNHA